MSFGPYITLPAKDWTKDVIGLTRHHDLASATDLGDGHVLVELRSGLTVKDLKPAVQAAVRADRTHQDQRRHQRRTELGALKADDLRAYAEAAGVDLKGVSLKADVIECIVDKQVPARVMAEVDLDDAKALKELTP